MANEIDIIIKSIFDASGFSGLQKQIKGLSANVRGFNSVIGDVKAFEKQKQMMQENTKLMQDAGLRFKKGAHNSLQFYDTINKNSISTEKAMGRLGGSIKKFSKNVKKDFQQPPFEGWALSVMFFGMLIQRMAQRVLTSSVAAFQQIIATTDGAVSSISILGAEWMSLKFSVGEAINSFIEAHPWINDLIQRVDEWVQNNQELTAGIVMVALALGVMLMAIGQLFLGLTGVWTMGRKFLFVLSPITKLLSGGLSAAGLTASFASIALAIGIVMAALIVLYAMWKTNFGGMKEFITETFGIVWDMIVNFAKDFWKIFKNVVDLVVAIFRGDWKEVGKLTLSLVINIIRMFAKLVSSLVAVLANVAIFIWNMLVEINVMFKKLAGLIYRVLMTPFILLKAAVKQIFSELINWLASKINGAIDLMANVEGFGWMKAFRIEPIEESLSIMDQFKKDMDEIEEKQKKAQDLYKDTFTADYISRDSVADWNSKIDSLADGLIDKLNLKDSVIEGDMAAVKEKFTGPGVFGDPEEELVPDAIAGMVPGAIIPPTTVINVHNETNVQGNGDDFLEKLMRENAEKDNAATLAILDGYLNGTTTVGR